MRVDFLSLENFRCFADRSLSFHPKFNVLIGENASGKTAVLEALAVAVGSWMLGLRGYPGRNIHPADVRLAPQIFGEEIRFEEQFPVLISAEGTIEDISIKWCRSINSPYGRTTSAEAGQIKKFASHADDQVRAGESVTLPAIAYYGSGRLWLPLNDTVVRRGSESKRTLSRLEGYRDSIDSRVSPRDLMRWLERQDRIAYQERKEIDLSRVVRTAMQGMIEDATAVLFDHKRLEVVVTFTDREPQPFSNLSDGQRSALALVGDLAMRMAKLNPHLEEQTLSQTPGIVLIDELDLHLHPNWQRRIVQYLKNTFPKVQFITSSHSPFIIQTLGEGELLPLETQPVPEFANLSIDTIANGLMGVPHPEVSPRYREMVDVGRSYLEKLNAASGVSEDQRVETIKSLADQITPFADNPAYQAFLEMRRIAKLGA